MRYLTFDETLELHRRLLDQTGGSAGIRDLGALESALAQPQMALGGDELSRQQLQNCAKAHLRRRPE